MNRMIATLLILIMMSLSACVSTQTKASFRNLSFGMTKSSVEDLIGEPRGVRAKDYGNATIEIWEYSVTDRQKKHAESYWVVFEDGKVSQWGRPEGFSPNEPEPIAR